MHDAPQVTGIKKITGPFRGQPCEARVSPPQPRGKQPAQSLNHWDKSSTFRVIGLRLMPAMLLKARKRVTGLPGVRRPANQITAFPGIPLGNAFPLTCTRRYYRGVAGSGCEARFPLEDLSRVRGVSLQDWRPMTIGPTSTEKRQKRRPKYRTGSSTDCPLVPFSCFRMCAG
jgi:hypothetical protein